MNVFRIHLFWVGIVCLTTSCTALHSPVSDAHLFDNRKAQKRVTRGVSLTSSQLSRGFTQELKKTYERDSSSGMLAARHRYGISYVSARGNETWSYGYALGSGGIGADVTWSPQNRMLYSIAVNAHGNMEGVVHSIIERDSVNGIGVGVFFRSERHGLLSNGCNSSDTWYCVDTSVDRHFRVHAIGLRVSFYQGNGQSPMRLYAGYSPELKRPVIIVGLNVLFLGRQ